LYGIISGTDKTTPTIIAYLKDGIEHSRKTNPECTILGYNSLKIEALEF